MKAWYWKMASEHPVLLASALVLGIIGTLVTLMVTISPGVIVVVFFGAVLAAIVWGVAQWIKSAADRQAQAARVEKLSAQIRAGREELMERKRQRGVGRL